MKVVENSPQNARNCTNCTVYIVFVKCYCVCVLVISISATDIRRKEVNSILLRLKESLSEAHRDSRHGTFKEKTLFHYKNRLRREVSALHSLGYPILSFYVDHHLSSRLSGQQHNTLVNTIHKLMYTTRRFAHSCSQDTAHGRSVSLCGSVHLHNLQSIHSGKFTMHIYGMQVPHMFYIQLQFLEIILLGGLRPYECERYQFLKVIYFFKVTLHLRESSVTPGVVICGTRKPFATVVPSNAALVKSVLNVHVYASFKLRYSAMDIQVSTKPLQCNTMQCNTIKCNTIQ